MFRLLLWAIAAIFRPKTLLIAENLCLQQQLLVLQRRYPRRRLNNADCRFWILGSRWFGGWRRQLRVVRPETFLRWHRRGWRAYWTRLPHRPVKRGRRPLPQELRALIQRMAAENWLWGQKRIQAALARLGFKVSTRTVAKYAVASQPRAIRGPCARPRPPPPPLRPCPGRAHEPPSAPNPADLWTTQERASPTNPQVQQQQQASAYSVRNGVERVPTLDPHANLVPEIHRPASRRTPGRLRRNPHRCGDRTS